MFNDKTTKENRLKGDGTKRWLQKWKIKNAIRHLERLNKKYGK